MNAKALFTPKNIDAFTIGDKILILRPIARHRTITDIKDGKVFADGAWHEPGAIAYPKDELAWSDKQRKYYNGRHSG